MFTCLWIFGSCLLPPCGAGEVLGYHLLQIQHIKGKKGKHDIFRGKSNDIKIGNMFWKFDNFCLSKGLNFWVSFTCLDLILFAFYISCALPLGLKVVIVVVLGLVTCGEGEFVVNVSHSCAWWLTLSFLKRWDQQKWWHQVAEQNSNFCNKNSEIKIIIGEIKIEESRPFIPPIYSKSSVDNVSFLRTHPWSATTNATNVESERTLHEHQRWWRLTLVLCTTWPTEINKLQKRWGDAPCNCSKIHTASQTTKSKTKDKSKFVIHRDFVGQQHFKSINIFIVRTCSLILHLLFNSCCSWGWQCSNGPSKSKTRSAHEFASGKRL